ncbi:hypothetical protein Y032_0080g1362 [Ancylostoma ceylanicum]|nr:hypothetical protein Y032_0080g1362 [Ancylostoma ceylanicum]
MRNRINKKPIYFVLVEKKFFIHRGRNLSFGCQFRNVLQNEQRLSNDASGTPAHPVSSVQKAALLVTVPLLQLNVLNINIHNP